MVPAPGYGQQLAAVPRLDLHAIAAKQAWRGLWMSILMTIGGLVVGALALAVGFIVFIAIIMIIAGIVMFFGALAAITDPTRQLKHLGQTEVQRRQTLRVVDAELSLPTTSILAVGNGRALLGPTWLAYHDNDTLLVTARNDVIWFYVIQKKRDRVLRVHLRGMSTVDITLDAQREAHLLPAFTYALPYAIQGYDPRYLSTPIYALASEVDRRRAAAGGYRASG